MGIWNWISCVICIHVLSLAISLNLQQAVFFCWSRGGDEGEDAGVCVYVCVCERERVVMKQLEMETKPHPHLHLYPSVHLSPSTHPHLLSAKYSIICPLCSVTDTVGVEPKKLIALELYYLQAIKNHTH